MASSHLLPHLQSSPWSIVIFTASSVPSESTKDPILERNKSWKRLSSGNSKPLLAFDSEPGGGNSLWEVPGTSDLVPPAKCYFESAVFPAFAEPEIRSVNRLYSPDGFHETPEQSTLRIARDALFRALMTEQPSPRRSRVIAGRFN